MNFIKKLLVEAAENAVASGDNDTAKNIEEALTKFSDVYQWDHMSVTAAFDELIMNNLKDVKHGFGALCENFIQRLHSDDGTKFSIDSSIEQTLLKPIIDSKESSIYNAIKEYKERIGSFKGEEGESSDISLIDMFNKSLKGSNIDLLLKDDEGKSKINGSTDFNNALKTIETVLNDIQAELSAGKNPSESNLKEFNSSLNDFITSANNVLNTTDVNTVKLISDKSYNTTTLNQSVANAINGELSLIIKRLIDHADSEPLVALLTHIINVVKASAREDHLIKDSVSYAIDKLQSIDLPNNIAGYDQSDVLKDIKDRIDGIIDTMYEASNLTVKKHEGNSVTGKLSVTDYRKIEKFNEYVNMLAADVEDDKLSRLDYIDFSKYSKRAIVKNAVVCSAVLTVVLSYIKNNAIATECANRISDYIKNNAEDGFELSPNATEREKQANRQKLNNALKRVSTIPALVKAGSNASTNVMNSSRKNITDNLSKYGGLGTDTKFDELAEFLNNPSYTINDLLVAANNLTDEVPEIVKTQLFKRLGLMIAASVSSIYTKYVETNSLSDSDTDTLNRYVQEIDKIYSSHTEFKELYETIKDVLALSNKVSLGSNVYSSAAASDYKSIINGLKESGNISDDVYNTFDNAINEYVAKPNKPSIDVVDELTAAIKTVTDRNAKSSLEDIARNIGEFIDLTNSESTKYDRDFRSDKIEVPDDEVKSFIEQIVDASKSNSLMNIITSASPELAEARSNNELLSLTIKYDIDSSGNVTTSVSDESYSSSTSNERVKQTILVKFTDSLKDGFEQNVITNGDSKTINSISIDLSSDGRPLNMTAENISKYFGKPIEVEIDAPEVFTVSDKFKGKLEFRASNYEDISKADSIAKALVAIGVSEDDMNTVSNDIINEIKNPLPNDIDTEIYNTAKNLGLLSEVMLYIRNSAVAGRSVSASDTDLDTKRRYVTINSLANDINVNNSILSDKISSIKDELLKKTKKLSSENQGDDKFEIYSSSDNGDKLISTEIRANELAKSIFNGDIDPKDVMFKGDVKVAIELWNALYRDYSILFNLEDLKERILSDGQVYPEDVIAYNDGNTEMDVANDVDGEIATKNEEISKVNNIESLIAEVISKNPKVRLSVVQAINNVVHADMPTKIKTITGDANIKGTQLLVATNKLTSSTAVKNSVKAELTDSNSDLSKVFALLNNTSSDDFDKADAFKETNADTLKDVSSTELVLRSKLNDILNTNDSKEAINLKKALINGEALNASTIKSIFELAKNATGEELPESVNTIRGNILSNNRYTVDDYIEVFKNNPDIGVTYLVSSLKSLYGSTVNKATLVKTSEFNPTKLNDHDHKYAVNISNALQAIRQLRNNRTNAFDGYTFNNEQLNTLKFAILQFRSFTPEEVKPVLEKCTTAEAFQFQAFRHSEMSSIASLAKADPDYMSKSFSDSGVKAAVGYYQVNNIVTNAPSTIMLYMASIDKLKILCTANDNRDEYISQAVSAAMNNVTDMDIESYTDVKDYDVKFNTTTDTGEVSNSVNISQLLKDYCFGKEHNEFNLQYFKTINYYNTGDVESSKDITANDLVYSQLNAIKKQYPNFLDNLVKLINREYLTSDAVSAYKESCNTFAKAILANPNAYLYNGFIEESEASDTYTNPTFINLLKKQEPEKYEEFYRLYNHSVDAISADTEVRQNSKIKNSFNESVLLALEHVTYNGSEYNFRQFIADKVNLRPLDGYDEAVSAVADVINSNSSYIERASKLFACNSIMQTLQTILESYNTLNLQRVKTGASDKQPTEIEGIQTKKFSASEVAAYNKSWHERDTNMLLNKSSILKKIKNLNTAVALSDTESTTLGQLLYDSITNTIPDKGNSLAVFLHILNNTEQFESEEKISRTLNSVEAVDSLLANVRKIFFKNLPLWNSLKTATFEVTSDNIKSRMKNVDPVAADMIARTFGTVNLIEDNVELYKVGRSALKNSISEAASKVAGVDPDINMSVDKIAEKAASILDGTRFANLFAYSNVANNISNVKDADITDNIIEALDTLVKAAKSNNVNAAKSIIKYTSGAAKNDILDSLSAINNIASDNDIVDSYKNPYFVYLPIQTIFDFFDKKKKGTVVDTIINAFMRNKVDGVYNANNANIDCIEVIKSLASLSVDGKEGSAKDDSIVNVDSEADRTAIVMIKELMNKYPSLSPKLLAKILGTKYDDSYTTDMIDADDASLFEFLTNDKPKSVKNAIEQIKKANPDKTKAAEVTASSLIKSFTEDPKVIMEASVEQINKFVSSIYDSILEPYVNSKNNTASKGLLQSAVYTSFDFTISEFVFKRILVALENPNVISSIENGLIVTACNSIAKMVGSMDFEYSVNLDNVTKDVSTAFTKSIDWKTLRQSKNNSFIKQADESNREGNYIGALYFLIKASKNDSADKAYIEDVLMNVLMTQGFAGERESDSNLKRIMLSLNSVTNTMDAILKQYIREVKDTLNDSHIDDAYKPEVAERIDDFANTLREYIIKCSNPKNDISTLARDLVNDITDNVLGDIQILSSDNSEFIDKDIKRTTREDDVEGGVVGSIDDNELTRLTVEAAKNFKTAMQDKLIGILESNTAIARGESDVDELSTALMNITKQKLISDTNVIKYIALLALNVGDDGKLSPKDSFSKDCVKAYDIAFKNSKTVDGKIIDTNAVNRFANNDELLTSIFDEIKEKCNNFGSIDNAAELKVLLMFINSVVDKYTNRRIKNNIDKHQNGAANLSMQNLTYDIHTKLLLTFMTSMSKSAKADLSSRWSYESVTYSIPDNVAKDIKQVISKYIDDEDQSDKFVAGFSKAVNEMQSIFNKTMKKYKSTANLSVQMGTLDEVSREMTCFSSALIDTVQNAAGIRTVNDIESAKNAIALYFETSLTRYCDSLMPIKLEQLSGSVAAVARAKLGLSATDFDNIRRLQADDDETKKLRERALKIIDSVINECNNITKSVSNVTELKQNVWIKAGVNILSNLKQNTSDDNINNIKLQVFNEYLKAYLNSSYSDEVKFNGVESLLASADNLSYIKEYFEGVA